MKAEIPVAVKGRVLSKRECLALIKRNRVPENIQTHVKLVNKIAMFLAKKLVKKGIPVDLEAVEAASLLHDLDKMPTLKTKNHGQLTQKLLTDMGCAGVGDIIAKHLPLYVTTLKTWEEKIVSYADRRAAEEGLVSLDERFAYLKKRYTIREDDKQKEIEQKFRELENEIMSIIGMKPEDLAERL